ncbi:MAG: hypothetical protein QXU74_00775 [Candidatus Aenigmatarchaeota archaeon]
MKFKLFSFTIIFLLMVCSEAMATCPVCVIAVAGGLELSRWLGIDDSITGIWIGGLLLSTSVWLANWLEKKFKFKFMKLLVISIIYSTSLLSLYWMKAIGYPSCSKLFGIDKLLIGIIAGTIAFQFSLVVNEEMKKRNKGKALFPFQKVVIPLIFLLIMSLIFYLITRC